MLASTTINVDLKLSHLVISPSQFRLVSEVMGVVITVKDYNQIKKMYLFGCICLEIQLNPNRVASINESK